MATIEIIGEAGLGEVLAAIAATAAASAPLESPTFTGTPAAPTPPAPTNTNQLATTAYVTKAAVHAAALSSLLKGEEGIAFDFMARSAVINDYTNAKSALCRPEDILTISRASSAKHYDRSRVLQTVGSNVLRYDHDPLSGAPRGLLVEPGATNLLQRSNEFDNAYWNKINATVTADAGVAPDGTTTADLVAENTANSNHALNVSAYFAISSSTTYCLSMLVKAAGRTKGRLVMASSGYTVTAQCSFDLVAKTATYSTGAGAPTSTGAGIEELTNGWFLVWVTANLGAFTTANAQLTLQDASGAISYTGDGVSGFLAADAQFELGANPGSRIKTTTATAARAADSYVIPASLFPVDPANCTILARSMMPRPTTGRLVSLQAASVIVDGHLLFVSSGIPSVGVFSGSVSQMSMSLGAAITPFVPFGVVHGFRPNDGRFIGSTHASPLTDTSAAAPAAPTNLWIGRDSGGTNLSGWIQRLAVINRRLTDTEMATKLAELIA